MNTRLILTSTLVLSIMGAAVATPLPYSFEFGVFSKAEQEGDLYRYSYLVFQKDFGPGYQYRGLSYIINIFPGEDAVDSVDWCSLQMWTNMGDASAWYARFDHGYMNDPATDTYFWGDKVEVPDGVEFVPDGDGISFEETDPYDWAGFGDNLEAFAEDADDPYIAYTFLSTYTPVQGSWLAKDGTLVEPDTGCKLVPGDDPKIPEPGTMLLLASGLMGLAATYRRR